MVEGSDYLRRYRMFLEKFSLFLKILNNLLDIYRTLEIIFENLGHGMPVLHVAICL